MREDAAWRATLHRTGVSRGGSVPQVACRHIGKTGLFDYDLRQHLYRNGVTGSCQFQRLIRCCQEVTYAVAKIVAVPNGKIPQALASPHAESTPYKASLMVLPSCTTDVAVAAPNSRLLYYIVRHHLSHEENDPHGSCFKLLAL